MPRTAKLFLLLGVSAVVVGVLAWHAGQSPPLRAVRGSAGAEPGWMPSNKSDRWTCIVIHHSATEEGNAERFDRMHRGKGWDELGYHFVIGNGSGSDDGQVEVGSRWKNQKHGAHCKTPDEYYNQHGIGICLVGNFDAGPPGKAQMRSLERLVRFLGREFDIPASRVYTHGQITGQTRCPGKFFDLKQFRKSIAAAGVKP